MKILENYDKFPRGYNMMADFTGSDDELLAMDFSVNPYTKTVIISLCRIKKGGDQALIHDKKYSEVPDTGEVVDICEFLGCPAPTERDWAWLKQIREDIINSSPSQAPPQNRFSG